MKEQIPEYLRNGTPFNYILTLSTVYKPEGITIEEYFYKNVDTALDFYNAYKSQGEDVVNAKHYSLKDLTDYLMMEDW